MVSHDFVECGSVTAAMLVRLCKLHPTHHVGVGSTETHSDTFLRISDTCLSGRYVLDAADHKNVDISREELHELLGKPSLKACNHEKIG